MKAVVVTRFGGTDGMEWLEVPMPEPRDGQVLIEVAHTSVNYADIKARTQQKGGSLPFVPGLDAAGTVLRVGAGVTRFRPGDRVIAFPAGGSYAEYAVADEALAFALPDGIPFDVAAACPIVSFLSHRLLTDIARLQPGEAVLVHAAAGGVGTTAIQLAKLLGAGLVIGTVGSAAKAAVAQAAGADHVVVYEGAPFAEEVNRLTGGAGVDIVLDSIAGRVTEQSLDCLAPYGRLVHFGNSSGEVGRVETKDLHASCRSILGFSLGTTRAKRPHTLRATAEQVLPLLAEGRLKMNIGRHFPLRDAAQAQEWIESRQSTGKVLLDVKA